MRAYDTCNVTKQSHWTDGGSYWYIAVTYALLLPG